MTQSFIEAEEQTCVWHTTWFLIVFIWTYGLDTMRPQANKQDLRQSKKNNKGAFLLQNFSPLELAFSFALKWSICVCVCVYVCVPVVVV